MTWMARGLVACEMNSEASISGRSSRNGTRWGITSEGSLDVD